MKEGVLICRIPPPEQPSPWQLEETCQFFFPVMESERRTHERKVWLHACACACTCVRSYGRARCSRPRRPGFGSDSSEPPNRLASCQHAAAETEARLLGGDRRGRLFKCASGAESPLRTNGRWSDRKLATTEEGTKSRFRPFGGVFQDPAGSRAAFRLRR